MKGVSINLYHLRNGAPITLYSLANVDTHKLSSTMQREIRKLWAPSLYGR